MFTANKTISPFSGQHKGLSHFLPYLDASMKKLLLYVNSSKG